ncbi:ATP-binding protein [Paraburkholderia tagetis]|uniref:histidine kinase n=1 Tax=Paraburkholderia tagetis TaxID=2913261 RepID=A0A9X1UHK1_9BURK|nr:ATP-binding protein [Paraburkholderia tagetis]MCG5076734.1 ATP-binding protein [Paraburkholderia tagetis]
MSTLPSRSARWFMSSLRRRLLLWLLPATLLAGVLASAATWWGSLAEIDEILNDQMKTIARHVVVDADGRLSLTGTDRKGRLSGRQSHGVLLQVWEDRKLVFSSDPDATLPPPQGPGYADVSINGQVWHTYVSTSGDMLVRVAQARLARWEALAEVSMHLFWPVLSLVPVVALLLWFGIGYGLRPLRQVASGLKRRDANNMQTIETSRMPNEVKPLVDALNDLLVRLDHAFTLQKHFIADAAHELRTPIMGLGLQAELLPKAESAQEHDEIVAQIRSGSERLTHLVAQLLTLARLDPDTGRDARQDVDLTALARSVVADRVRLAEANQIDLGLASEQAVSVDGYGENLRVLLNNLVDNAIRYAGAHARVDVVVRQEGPCPVLEVSDNGPGIPEADRARVWERFYRGSGHAAQAVSGSGLGLSIVRRIAEQHQASVTLDSGPDGRGLIVRVRFPSRQPLALPGTETRACPST